MQEEGGTVSTRNGTEDAHVPSEEVCSLSPSSLLCGCSCRLKGFPVIAAWTPQDS